MAVNPWEFHPHPESWALLGSLAAAYVVALRHLGPRLARAGEPVVTGRQQWQFGAGMVLLWIGAEWPVHDLAESYLFWVHMVQHTLFSLIAPPLLLLGTPAWLKGWILDRLHARRVVARLARPLAAAALFNGVIALSHWPAWVDATLRSEVVHFLAHVVLFSVSSLMWLPVVNRDPALPTLSPPVKMLYLFLQSIVPTVPASFLAFAEQPLYRFYAEAPRVFGISAVEDQQIAGGIMKVGGTAILWTVIVVIFFRWYAESQRRGGSLEALTWTDVERQFERSAPIVEG